MGRPAITVCQCGSKKRCFIWQGKKNWICEVCRDIKRHKYRKEKPEIDDLWREKNREKLRKQSREFRIRNIEKEKQRGQDKYQRYRREKPELFKKWYMNSKNTPKSRFKTYVANAKHRNLECLKFEKFMTFWQKDCEYCGRKIETIGIDRVDNTKGYIQGNLKACCAICNRMKMNYTEAEFLEQCKRIVDYQDAYKMHSRTK